MENPISPLASLAVMFRNARDLFPIFGDEGVTELIKADAVEKKLLIFLASIKFAMDHYILPTLL